MALKKSLLALSLLCVSTTASQAAGSNDPSWPCVQRKVLHLTPALMWTGPAIDESLPDWREDDEISRLAHLLAARRTPLEKAEKMIAEFAKRSGEERNRRLTMLFAGVFDVIDRERTEVIGGIGRYARKQTSLGGQLDETRDALSALEAKENRSLDEEDKLEELQDKVNWQTRIFKERQHSLTYVCEAPVILEKRAFALAKAIAGQLE